MTGALAIIAACLTVLYRDIEHLIQTVLLPWFFLTPIFYTFDALPGIEGHSTIRAILYWEIRSRQVWRRCAIRCSSGR